jgi:hypothetical protein
MKCRPSELRRSLRLLDQVVSQPIREKWENKGGACGTAFVLCNQGYFFCHNRLPLPMNWASRKSHFVIALNLENELSGF